MPGPRKAIPRAVRDQVMDEFNHLCAICAKANPQLHHIDEDHSNNDPLNLLPLCPNHHLSDQHSPTRRIEIGIVSLFRRYKDPAILSPQFEPLYARMRYLLELDYGTAPRKGLNDASRELVEFVAALEMGDFYSKRLKKLTFDRALPRTVRPGAPSSFTPQPTQIEHDLKVAHLLGSRDDAVDLCVELLRYQSWTPAAGI